jgi:hypothetical protein
VIEGKFVTVVEFFLLAPTSLFSRLFNGKKWRLEEGDRGPGTETGEKRRERK